MIRKHRREAEMALHGVSVQHNFETAHRLWTVPGKCQNLHGHSWKVEIMVEWTQLDARGMVIEYGELKKLFRGWIDTHFDHGTLLDGQDPLFHVFRGHDLKVYAFNGNPTVERVAAEIAEVVTEDILPQVTNGAQVRLAGVTVSETATNSAFWAPLP